MHCLLRKKGPIIADSSLAPGAQTATFEIDPALRPFLAPELRGNTIEHAYARAATLKQAIEALGIPHTEVGEITVNDQPATLARTVRAGDRVTVGGYSPGTAPFDWPLAFAADAHLGGLAHWLRMLGFDTVFDQSIDDAELARIAGDEHRVVLTRDRELLKRREVLRGSYVRALRTDEQLGALALRYPIAEAMAPFTLCLHCNLRLDPATPAEIEGYVPERIRERYAEFMHCGGCGRVYWQGSHWTRMRQVLAQTLGVPIDTLGSTGHSRVTAEPDLPNNDQSRMA